MKIKCLNFCLSLPHTHTGYVAYTSQEALNPNTSPMSGDGSQTPFTYPTSDAPKPRKFFKSRNTVAVVDQLPPPPFVPSPNDHQSSSSSSSLHASPYGGGGGGGSPLVVARSPAHASTLPVVVLPAHKQAPKIRLKINKKQLLSDTNAAALPAVATAKPAKLPKPAKVKKPPKPVKEKPVKPVKPAKPVAEPTRKLSRARKTVNYSENRSRSPTPKRSVDEDSESLDTPMDGIEEDTTASSSVPATHAIAVVPVNTPLVGEPTECPASPSVAPSMSEEDESAETSTEIPAIEHPPIVLRISKVCFLYIIINFIVCRQC